MAQAIVDIDKPLGIAVHDHITVGKDGGASLEGLRRFRICLSLCGDIAVRTIHLDELEIDCKLATVRADPAALIRS
jgi:hypothetical protein